MDEPDPPTDGTMLMENPDFLEHCYRRVLGELGFSNEHAEVVALCVSDGDRNGKLTQGMGVFEIPVLLARTGTMDVTAVPEVVDEGPTWLVIDARRSSGQWALTMAATAAIAKARDHAIAIAFVRDFNDAGAFGTYVRMAAAEGMLAMATNNSLPLVSPWGGMQNVLSGAPFAAATPGARLSPQIPGPPSYWLEPRDEALTGGACVIVIDPSHWMPADGAGRKSDELVEAVKGAKRRPGVEEIFLPGERGWRAMASGDPVEILPAHWESFVQIVHSVGLTIDALRGEHSSET